MKQVVLIKYGEIALRGGNRRIYENKLITNIRKNLNDLDENYYVIKEQGRFILENVDGDVNFSKVMPRLEKVLGVIAICPCIKMDTDNIDEICEVALQHMKDTYKNPVSFKVETKRANKKYPMESREVSTKVGGYIYDNIDGLTVKMDKPDVTLMVELRTCTYVYTQNIKTFGGLPAGSSGKGVLLLSGGIDSPVAGFMMAKRGVELTCVYFHSPPYTSERAKQKVKDLAKQLDYFTGTIKLYVVPFTEIQLFLYEKVQPEKLTILLKHTMLKISEQIAEKEKAYGLIVGDSVGQVASQTMHSIMAVSQNVNMPIYRPLCGMDKQEIINIATKIETLEISNLPYEDCCTIFTALHPETKPKANIIGAIARKLEDELKPMIEVAIESSEIVKF